MKKPKHKIKTRTPAYFFGAEKAAESQMKKTGSTRATAKLPTSLDELKERTTRRAPHMEKYVFVTKGFRYRVHLKVGVQSFTLDGDFDVKKEAEFMRDMLCIALDAIVKDGLATMQKLPKLRGRS